MKNDYRADVDVLRAIAVILVFLYHLNVPFIKGGFIGVDVFFVISGYLISKKILASVESGDFNLINFFWGRAFRLLPASIVVIIATLIAGAIFFSPVHLERLGKSAVMGLAFLANFFFYGEAGYFDVSKDYKPLLHMWSLSLEEQFYFIWPFMLLAYSKLKSKRIKTLSYSSLLVVASIATQLVLLRDQSAAFFLLPFRVPEFLLGFIVAEANLKIENKNYIQSFLTAIGLLLIFVSAFSYSSSLLFPGFSALLPCIGAAIFIALPQQNFIKNFLQKKIIIYIGKISYSIYLLHWPIIVFYKYVVMRQLDIKDMILVSIMTLISSFLLCKYIENPARRAWAKNFNIKKYSILGIGGMGVVAFSSLFFLLSDGWIGRYKPEMIKLNSNLLDSSLKRREKLDCLKSTSCTPYKSGKKTIAIFGDSYAEDFALVLHYFDPHSNNILIFAKDACKPLRGSTCRDFDQWIEEALMKNYDYYVFSMQYGSLEQVRNLSRTIESLQIPSEKLVVVGPRINLSSSSVHIASRSKEIAEYQKLSISLQKLEFAKQINSEIKKYEALNQGTYLNFSEIQLENKFNNTVEGSSIYIDTGHLTIEGAQQMAKILKKDKHYKCLFGSCGS